MIIIWYFAINEVYIIELHRRMYPPPQLSQKTLAYYWRTDCMLRLFSEQEPCSTCTHVNYKQKQENTDWLYKLEAEMRFPHIVWKPNGPLCLNLAGNMPDEILMDFDSSDGVL